MKENLVGAQLASNRTLYCNALHCILVMVDERSGQHFGMLFADLAHKGGRQRWRSLVTRTELGEQKPG